MIGIFDSGIGGLSVLKALRVLIPSQDYFYLADSGYAPYGERNSDYVLNRSRICLQALLDKGCDQIVIACNTATAVAAKTLRAEHPTLPIVGIEPAIKPAAALTKNGHVGVLATEGTLESQKFKTLLTMVQATTPNVQFHLHAPRGLALAIEQQDLTRIESLVATACKALLDKGCDTVVLGCTHYPLVLDVFKKHLPNNVQIMDPAHAVALQAQKLLPNGMSGSGHLQFESSGNRADLLGAIARYLPSAPLNPSAP